MSLQSGRETGFCRSCLWPTRSFYAVNCPSCSKSIGARKRYENPREREKFGLRMKKYWKQPGIKEKLVLSARKRWADPDNRIRQSEALKKYFENPEAIKKNSETQKNCLAHIVAMNDPKYRKKLSLAQKKCWAREEERGKRIAGLKESWAKPGNHEKRSGPNSCLWRGGASEKIYGLGFSKTLRQAIKKRDDYTCQNPRCYIPENGKPHHVHHVDYSKNNHNLSNLITLCISCHGSTINGNREYWMEYYQNIQALRGISPCS